MCQVCGAGSGSASFGTAAHRDMPVCAAASWVRSAGPDQSRLQGNGLSVQTELKLGNVLAWKLYNCDVAVNILVPHTPVGFHHSALKCCFSKPDLHPVALTSPQSPVH